MKFGLIALLLLWLGFGHAQANDSPLVAVASSLRHVWPHLMRAYQPADKPRVTFGSSGNLARQIVQGAPFNLLLSADETFPDWLVEKKATDQSPSIYAQGRLAWIAPAGSPLAKAIMQAESSAQATLVVPDEVSKVSVANPAFAPYGRAAKTVLNNITGGNAVTLVVGENASQALQFALSGATDGGIVPFALVSDTSKDVLSNMVVSEISASLHVPVVHAMVSINQPNDATKALFDFLLSDAAQAILAQHGFLKAQQQ